MILSTAKLEKIRSKYVSKKNNDFFKVKKAWSEVKDELLGCYFKPYVQKILHTFKPLIYVDCFAGKGKFEDGRPGSPIIALDIIRNCESVTTMESTNISAHFIDLNYADDLQKNLSCYPNVNIYSGKYEEKILEILKNKSNCNVFLYIDPYGIKALNCSLFDNFAQRGFNSIELLINMNSFGFIREACNAMGTKFEDNDLFDDLVEYETSKFIASEKSIKDLDEIAGGKYWQDIIKEYKEGKIDGYEAEKRFAEQYCRRLSQQYKYVLNLPLRIKQGQRPKYRMIHATNHKDGCLLMVDNIYNRWQALIEIQHHGQLSFFEENYDNEIIDTTDIEEKAKIHFSKYKQLISLSEALANFFVEYGAICSTGDIKKIIRDWEKSRTVEIVRSPSTTTNGKPATFMTEGHGNRIYLRWNK